LHNQGRINFIILNRFFTSSLTKSNREIRFNQSTVRLYLRVRFHTKAITLTLHPLE
jgi:hypothetical protein